MSPSWFFKKKGEPGGPESLTAAEEKAPIAPHGTERGATPETEKKPSLFARALAKTRTGMKSVFTFRRALDETFIDEIEAELYAADFGPETVEALVGGPEGIRAAWKSKRIEKAEEVREFLKGHLKGILTKRDSWLVVSDIAPTVVVVAGVNGAGKTTSIAKLAKRLRDGGSSVLLAAADTFRAAAVEQLMVWGERLGVDVVAGEPGADPASVAFRGAEAALEKKVDFLIVDTAGRLHTQKNLMRELGKIRSVLAKKIPGSPHECLLVLDATTGQNALNQAKLFQDEVPLTGIVLAKLDGTAKGGIVVSINNVLDIPVKFVGLGETIDDMEPFDAKRFVDAVFE
jgi:fused signal recognition particle receptor